MKYIISIISLGCFFSVSAQDIKEKLAEKTVKLPKKAIYGYIVSSSLPKEANQKYRKLKEIFHMK